jgi:hypothetical protein
MYPGAFDPDFQLSQIERGHRLLPWFMLARPDEGDGKLDASYYTHPIERLAKWHLPISFISTQWDALVVEDICRDQKASTVETAEDSVCNGRTKLLSPFSPKEAWYRAGLVWGRLPVLRRLQTLYPDPPLILFISNNEQPKLTWMQLRKSRQPRTGVSGEDNDVSLRRDVGNAWIERYRELQRGFRDGLERDEWKRAARFVGYDAFGPSALGRWPGWIEYSLYIPGRIDPWPLALDGASVSYYVNDWNPSTDFNVWSPQIEAMNWVPMATEATRRNPNFWLELSVWDGQRPGQASDKLAFYRALGQRYDASRYSGLVQFGMWLMRPRLVREFRDYLETRAQFGSYFKAVTDSVDRVYDLPALKRFWLDGRLLENSAQTHPYQEAVPKDFAEKRWFLLDTVANPPRPWNLATQIAVFSIALELGRPPAREWLVYAFSPLETATTAKVQIPAGPLATVALSREGCFTVIHEEASANTSMCATVARPASRVPPY